MTRPLLQVRLWMKKNDYKVEFAMFVFYVLLVLSCMYGVVWMVADIQK